MTVPPDVMELEEALDAVERSPAAFLPNVAVLMHRTRSLLEMYYQLLEELDHVRDGYDT